MLNDKKENGDEKKGSILGRGGERERDNDRHAQLQTCEQNEDSVRKGIAASRFEML